MMENKNGILDMELELEDLDFEFIEDKDLEEISGGFKIAAIYIEAK